jgi:hypothetical protein
VPGTATLILLGCGLMVLQPSQSRQAMAQEGAPEFEQSVDLSRLRSYALANNPDIKAAEQRWRPAQARPSQEGSKSLGDLQAAVEEGAVQRIRPKMMTVLAILMGLLPIMWSQGTGADVMKRIAAPMVGGVVTSFVLELLIYPVIFTIWKWHRELQPRVVAASA